MKPRAKKPFAGEAGVQFLIVQHIKIMYPNALYCASAGGMFTSMKQAIKMKATGYVKGFPDLQICEPNGKYFGLFIEVKFADGKQQPNQKKFQAMVEHHGYCYKIVRSLDDLIDVLRIFKSDPIIDQYQAGYRSGYMDGKLQEQILR